jgi:hypothetical protein
MPAFRITHIEADGPSAEAVKQVALDQLTGTYWYIVPRNSVFFYPKERLRAAVIKAIPDISAVSLTRTTFSSLAVHTTPRAKSFIWCGTSIDTPVADGSCYQTDIEGFIFKKDEVVTGIASTSTSTMPSTQGDVRLFGAIDRDISDGSSPLGAHMVAAAQIPNALKFVDAVRELGAPVSALAIRGDEADLWLNGPTRITYVLGEESSAAELAASALPALNLTDGSIKYVDLRFKGKAYIGRYGE